MKVTVLGCGGSFGSPLAWNRNGNIDINNPKNHRTRSSVLININDQNLLIDTSPDLRAQLYNARCTKIDAVLFTHEHSDHTSGLPDMRAMSLINQSIIPAFLSSDIKDYMTRNYHYIFDGHRDYSPFMSVKTIESTFSIGNTEINTFKHNHGSIDVQTYRINNFAYSTDLKNFYENFKEGKKNFKAKIKNDLYDVCITNKQLKEIEDEIIKYIEKKTESNFQTFIYGKLN